MDIHTRIHDDQLKGCALRQPVMQGIQITQIQLMSLYLRTRLSAALGQRFQNRSIATMQSQLCTGLGVVKRQLATNGTGGTGNQNPFLLCWFSYAHALSFLGRTSTKPCQSLHKPSHSEESTNSCPCVWPHTGPMPNTGK